MRAAAANAEEAQIISGQQWLILSLLVLSIGINYIDRANLSVAVDDLRRELSVDDKRMGTLLGSFFWTYTLCQIPVGWLIDRFNVYWVYATGYFIWSLATALTGLAGAYSVIFALRLLLGVAESVAYPSYSKIIAAGFPEEQRGLPNALIDAGSKMGPFLGVLIGGSIVATYGWRVMFIAIGGVSMLWLAPWIGAIRRGTGHAERKHEQGPGVLTIFTKRAAWGTFIGLLGSNYAWYFLLTWLPSYLRRERHYSTEAMATLGSIPFLAVAASAVFSGWLSDYLITRGASPTLIRKGFAIGGLTFATLLFPAATVESPNLALVLLTAASLSFGLYTSNVWAITQCLAGTAAAGKWTGIQNTFGNVSGIVAPALTGWIVQETHSFMWAFAAACGALILSASAFLLLVRRVAPLNWNGNSRIDEYQSTVVRI